MLARNYLLIVLVLVSATQSSLLRSLRPRHLSWQDYVNAYLTNYVDQTNGKSYLNACEHGAIVSNTDGTVWASSSGFTFGKYTVQIDKEDGSGTETFEIDEFSNLLNAFDNDGTCTAKGGIRINKEKFFIVSYDADKKVMYLKKSGGGAAVARSNQAFVIGIFSTSKKTTVKTGTSRSEQAQSPGVTNTGVEKLQEFLTSSNL